MSKSTVNVAFEVDSETGAVNIVKRRMVEKKRKPGENREVLERTQLSFILPKKHTPRKNEEHLYQVLFGMMRNPV